MRSLFVFLLLLPGFCSSAYVRWITISTVKSGNIPERFYVTDVVDDRANTKKDGTVSLSGQTDTVMFIDGLAETIKHYLYKLPKGGKAKRSVIMHIVGFDVSAKKEGGMWSIKASAAVAFYADGSELIRYNATSTARTAKDPPGYCKEYLCSTLDKDLQNFDEWCRKHNSNGTARGAKVIVKVKMGKATERPDAIVYSLSRPLKIADFMGTPNTDDAELAATASGMQLSTSSVEDDDEVVVNVTITPYFDKRGSFFKEKGKNATVLAHEQAHFDITALRVCKTKELIEHTTFTAEHYADELERIRMEAMKQMSEDQAQYDSETSHGVLTDKQIEWQIRLKNEVRSSGCY